MLLGEYFSEAFEWMMRGGVIRAILPELTGSGCDLRRFPGGSRSAGGGMQEDLPELVELPGKIDQRAHSWGALEHTVNTVQGSPPRLRVRLAALFHNLSELNVAHQNKVTMDLMRHSG